MSKSKCQMSNDEQQECWNNGRMEQEGYRRQVVRRENENGARYRIQGERAEAEN
jgi:hypothetical protein